ncbi:MAG TPA: hypothetical protein VGC35_11745 [Allosphingosinicella sp.]|jgi:hypothetical protein
MAQSGFAIFFVLALIAGLAAMASSWRQNRVAIVSALRRAAPERVADPVFTSSVRPTSELPRVARFLRLDYAVDLAPVTREVRAWTFERADPSGPRSQAA